MIASVVIVMGAIGVARKRHEKQKLARVYPALHAGRGTLSQREDTSPIESDPFERKALHRPGDASFTPRGAWI